MFGREFQAGKHRQHIVPSPPTGYGFEVIGSRKEALGLSGLSVGDEVYWYGGGDDVDTSASGVIVEMPAVDPDGRVHSDMAAVEWADEGYDIVEVNSLLNAEHYNIGQGYSQVIGSRKEADISSVVSDDNDAVLDFFWDTFPRVQSTTSEIPAVRQWEIIKDTTPHDALRDIIRSEGSGYLSQEESDTLIGDLTLGWAASRKQASSYKQEQIIDAYYAGEFGNRVKGIEFVDNPSLVNKQVYLHIRARGKQKIFVPWNGEWYGAGGSGNGLYDLKRYLKNWGKHSSRRTAFLDTVELTGPRHRVAGWNWDDHLNGFVAAEAAREFTCACGDNVPAPGYTDCRCGKRWNTYTIQANGSKKMIAREVPVRENVVMANRRTAFRKQAADYSDYSYDQLVDERDILRQQYADWEIDQSEYKDTLAEIEAEAESRGLTLASRKGRVVARRTASERDQVLEDWIAFLEKKGLPRNTGTWEPEASDFDSSGYSGEAMEFLYEWSSGKMGSRKRASDAYLDELREWYPVEYNAFMESLSPGTVYEPGELEILHKKWVQTQGPFDEGGDGMTASRKQALAKVIGSEPVFAGRKMANHRTAASEEADEAARDMETYLPIVQTHTSKKGDYVFEFENGRFIALFRNNYTKEWIVEQRSGGPDGPGLDHVRCPDMATAKGRIELWTRGRPLSTI